MTFEDLSHASADRYADRMMHDVRSTNQIRFPPPRPPTFSARESLETPTFNMDDNIITARVVTDTSTSTTAITTPQPVISTKVSRTVQERFQEFHANFERLEPMLSSHLSTEEKKRFVRAIMGPGSMHRPETLTIIVSIIVVVITAIVCLSNSPPNPNKQTSRFAQTSHHLPDNAISSTTKLNISRLLKPLNRNR